MINSGEADWDPPLPRKPGLRLAILALVLILAGTAFGLYELNGALATRYAPKANACMATDLGPLSTLSGGGTPAIAPDEVVGGQCRIQFVGDDGLPTAFGRVTIGYTGSRLASRIEFAQHQDDELWTAIGGIGEEAWQYSMPHVCSFQVTVRDVNTVLVIELAGIPEGGLCSRVADADVQKALAASAKGTLAKL